MIGTAPNQPAGSARVPAHSLPILALQDETGAESVTAGMTDRGIG